MNKIIPIIIGAVFIIAVFVLLQFSFSYKPTCKFVKNCDFTYDPVPTGIWVTNGFSDYSGYQLGAGWYEAGAPINGRSSLMLMHAQTPTSPSTINQTFYLPVIFQGAKYNLRVSVANIGSYYFQSKDACYASRFVVKMFDNQNVESTLLDTVVNGKDGWKEFKLDISKYNGQNVVVQLESWAHEQCNNFEGAFGAVDYIDAELA